MQYHLENSSDNIETILYEMLPMYESHKSIGDNHLGGTGGMFQDVLADYATPILDKLMPLECKTNSYLSLVLQCPALLSSGLGLLIAVATVGKDITPAVTMPVAATIIGAGLIVGTAATFFSMPRCLSKHVVSLDTENEAVKEATLA